MHSSFSIFNSQFCTILGLTSLALIATLSLRHQFADFHEFVRRTPPMQRTLLALLAAGFIAYGSTKTENGEAISRSLQMEFAPPFTSGPESASLFSVTPADIARGWQLVGVGTNEAVGYAKPEGAVLASNWWVRGAFEDVLKIEPNPAETAQHPAPSTLHQTWRFPFGTNTYSSIWAFSWGKVRFRFGDTNEIVAVGSPMSAVPYCSRLWTLETNDAFLVTWEGFAQGRIRTVDFLQADRSPLPRSVNAQIELRRNGDFITRSNTVESAYRRVDPEDWDGDGIPNGDDANPYFRDGDFFGPWQTLPDEANENAYCWVEIAADVNAHVVFTGNGESDLPDPDFMLRAGETNRVALLIGKTYFVESSQPLTVTDRSSAAIEVGGSGSRSLTIVWPVNVYAMEGNGASFMMRVVPDSIGGEFEWTDGCCPVTGSGRVFSFSCNATCLCTGCYPSGFLVYEGYSIPVTGGHCGCSCGPHQALTVPDGEQMVAGVSASFSPEAVIFEDTYTNRPGEVVYGRSTEAVLSCEVHGGFRGGTATFAFAGETNLVWIRGAAVPQTSVAIPPGEKLEFAAAYEGLRPSAEAEDITYTVTFTENDTTNAPTVVEAKLTSVKVQLAAVYDAPENPNPSRHVYGVGEKVKFTIAPALTDVIITTEKLDEGDTSCAYELFDGCETSVDGGAEHIYTCPIASDYHPPIEISILGATHRPMIEIVEPSGVITLGVDWFGCHSPGDVGQSTLITTNYIGPLTVSFRGVRVAEVPCEEAIEPTGYFATPNFTGFRTHTIDAGAGLARIIQGQNRWTVDEAGGGEYLNWAQGELKWKIPIGWFRVGPDEREFGTVDCAELVNANDPCSRKLLIGGSTDVYKQIFTIDEDGTAKVEKFDHWLSRGRYCRIILDGKTKKWNHWLWEEH